MATPSQPDPEVPEPDLVPPDQGDPLAMAQYLGTSMTNLAKQLKAAKKASEDRDEKLDRYARKSRLYIVVDVALTVALGAMGFWISSTSDRASSADASAAAANVRAAAATAAEQALHNVQVSQCESSNQSRAGELALWDYLFHESKPTTKAQAAAIAAFMRQVDATFAPRNCIAIYAVKPQPKETDSGTR